MKQYHLEKTKTDYHTLIYKSKDATTRLHSAYDPIKESDRLVKQFSIGRASIIVVLGLGLGYHIKFLKEKFPETPIIIFEKESEVIALAQSYYPKFLTETILISSAEDIPSLFENIDISDFKGIKQFVHRASYSINKDFYDLLLQEMNQYISSKISDLMTRFEFEEKWFHNILKNVPFLFNNNRVETLFNSFKGYPGVIISAGPSLRKNAHLLNTLKKKALLVAVDTSAKVLDKLNITPHIVMTLDAQRHSIRHFLGLKNKGQMLLADLVSYPGILKSFQGEIFLSTTSKYYNDFDGNIKRETTPFMDWIEQYIPPVGDIQSGGSVATSAFDLLLNLGCNPIILVGQDLAYTGREIHCSGTHHNDGWLPITNRFKNLDTINQAVVRKRKIKHVPAFGSTDADDTVISDFVFDLYKNWFEDSASRVPITVINATEGGARIHNTQEDSLSSLLASLPDKKKTPLEILMNNINGEPIDSNKLKKALITSIEELEKLFDEAQEIKKATSLTKVASLLTTINSLGLESVYTPYFRKTKTFIARHNPEEEKIFSMFLQDIAQSTPKIIKLFQDCADRL